MCTNFQEKILKLNFGPKSQEISLTMALQQVNSSIENTKFQMTQIQEAISALKKWEVEFNTYLAGVDAQSKQVLASTEELKIKEQQLDAEINAESQRQVDFQEENARDAQVDILTFKK